MSNKRLQVYSDSNSHGTDIWYGGGAVITSWKLVGQLNKSYNVIE